jgi:uncharacterized protein YbjT (DUF2867 family)
LKVLVTGVTGKTGRRVAESLVSRGVDVRALVRDLERGKMATLGMGVELVIGDFDQLDTIAAAASDCEGMYLVSVDGPAQVKQEVDAAKTAVQAGIEHIVKLSSSDAGSRPYAWSVAHAEIESLLSGFDVSCSFIRPHFFMENYLSLLRVSPGGTITLEAPAQDGLIGAIDSYDIGEVAAALLEKGTAIDTPALLTGPANISMKQVANAFSDAINRVVDYVDLDPQTYLSTLEIEGTEHAGDVADVYEEVRVGTMALHSDVVERVTGNRPRTIEQFATANAGEIESAISLASSE